MVFQQADFTEGLPLAENEKPYDLYFSSYGTCSHHNDDETMIRLLAEIAQRTEDTCLIVCDWLGRYSYEWQTCGPTTWPKTATWTTSSRTSTTRKSANSGAISCSTSACGSSAARKPRRSCAEASQRAGVEIKPLGYFDRSVFTGRHMDTAEYNPTPSPSARRSIRCTKPTAHRPQLAC